MYNMNFLDLLLNEPGQVLVRLSAPELVGLLLLVAAGLLGTVRRGACRAGLFRGKSVRFSWGNLAANLGGLVWLLPVAAVFALYGFWMRPSLFNLGRRSGSRRSVLGCEPFQCSASRPLAGLELVSPERTLPDWVHENEVIASGPMRFVVVTGEIGATLGGGCAVARGAAVELVRDDFRRVVPQVAGWEPPAASVAAAAIRRTFVEEIDRKTHSSGIPFRVYRAYDQVELSPRVRRQIFPFWKDEIVGRRIWALGGLAGLLTLTFATLAAYFRLDDRTSGLYRRG